MFKLFCDVCDVRRIRKTVKGLKSQMMKQSFRSNGQSQDQQKTMASLLDVCDDSPGCSRKGQTRCSFLSVVLLVHMTPSSSVTDGVLSCFHHVNRVSYVKRCFSSLCLNDFCLFRIATARRVKEFQRPPFWFHFLRLQPTAASPGKRRAFDPRRWQKETDSLTVEFHFGIGAPRAPQRPGNTLMMKKNVLDFVGRKGVWE